MEKNKIVSVSEFSKMANMPKTEIYKLISLPEYAVYISKIAGKKYIDIKLLEKLSKENEEVETVEEIEPEKEPEKPKPQKEENKKISGEGDREFLDFLLTENRELRQQIQEKDKIIIDLTTKLSDLTSQAQTIAENALITTSQAQALQAMDKQEPTKKKGLFRLFGRNKEKNE